MTRDHSGPGPLRGHAPDRARDVACRPVRRPPARRHGSRDHQGRAARKPDPLREWGQARYEGRTLFWPVQSRNKKCITLNLREARGQELLLELVRVADVLTENFRPGTLERWNLGYDRLSAVNPGIVLARISGYGQTGPYAERAGFASVAEAMGGLRYINGFPGEAPPRTGISLGDSLAAMFAVQGILAALYHRDVLGNGRGQVVDVSLMEASFALLESAVPEYDRLGVVRQPAGTNLKGIAPSNIFKSRDDLWLVIAANHDNLFRRLCEAMGRPELADDPRFETHVARGENQGEIEGIVAEWAARHDAREIDRILNDAGVVCGPIYTMAEIFEDPQYRARDSCRRARRPGVRSVYRPGHRAEVLGDARRGAVVGHLGGRQPQRGDLLWAARPDGFRAGRAERGWGDMRVTICDVGPRDGLQNQPVTLEPAVRAELVDLLAAAGVPRIEAVSFVSPKHVPQMAGAEEVVAALERREGVVYAGLAVNERGYERLRETGLDEVHSPPSQRPRSSTSETRTRPWPRALPAPSESSSGPRRTAFARR